MDANGKELFNLMKEMTQDLAKVVPPLDRPYQASLAKLERDYEGAEILDHLRDALKNICDAWWSINEAMKKSVYFEEDEDEVKQMKVVLNGLEKTLTRVLETRGGV